MSSLTWYTIFCPSWVRDGSVSCFLGMSSESGAPASSVAYSRWFSSLRGLGLSDLLGPFGTVPQRYHLFDRRTLFCPQRLQVPGP